MKTYSLSALLLTGLLASTACTDEEKKLDEPIQTAAETTDEHAFKVDESTGKVEFEAPIVYFGFDQATLTEKGMERLSALADHMKQHPKLKVKIEGHCDARGSTEYNLALGQRRSETVRKFLLTYGITQERLTAISFGEEQPG
jgi:peptidoglycan-associated lipoprotein